jgi:hypothetical protein
MFRSIFKPAFEGIESGPAAAALGHGGGSGGVPGSVASAAAAAAAAGSCASPAAGVAASRWFLTDRIASLREAFRRTPAWLGFNIELKYPTPMEVAAMRAQFYNRNHFVDAVLRVGGHGWVGGRCMECCLVQVTATG